MTRRDTILALGAIPLLSGGTASTEEAPQPPSLSPSPAQAAAMEKLRWLAGRWKGEVVIETGPGMRRTFTQKEHVQSKLKGAILLIEGTATCRAPGSDREATVFEALAVISYDDVAKRYRWQAFTGGQYRDASAEVTGSVIRWSMTDTPMGAVRYTIKRTEAGAWHEIGESSRDGKTWRKFLEMTLSPDQA